MKAMSILGIIFSSLGTFAAIFNYFLCDGITNKKISGGLMDHLEIWQWEPLLNFNSWAIQQAEIGKIVSIIMLLFFLFCLAQSIVSVKK
jgi:hypothetical protein